MEKYICNVTFDFKNCSEEELNKIKPIALETNRIMKALIFHDNSSKQLKLEGRKLILKLTTTKSKINASDNPQTFISEIETLQSKVDSYNASMDVYGTTFSLLINKYEENMKILKPFIKEK